jgi:hypothetical protein
MLMDKLVLVCYGNHSRSNPIAGTVSATNQFVQVLKPTILPLIIVLEQWQSSTDNATLLIYQDKHGYFSWNYYW